MDSVLQANNINYVDAKLIEIENVDELKKIESFLFLQDYSEDTEPKHIIVYEKSSNKTYLYKTEKVFDKYVIVTYI